MSLDRLAELQVSNLTSPEVSPPQAMVPYRSAGPRDTPAALSDQRLAVAAKGAHMPPWMDERQIATSTAAPVVTHADGGAYPSLAPAARYHEYNASVRAANALLLELQEHAAHLPRASTRAAIDDATQTIRTKSLSMQANLRDAKEQLKSIAEGDAAFAAGAGANSTAAEIRSNMYTQAVRELSRIVTMLQRTLQYAEDQLQRRNERELRLVAPQLPDASVKALVESGRAGEYVQTQLLSDEPSEELLRAAQSVQSRHDSIAALEQQVRQLAELFADLEWLVNAQQESIDVISEHMRKTRDRTVKAEAEIVQAREYQKRGNCVTTHARTR